MAPALSASTMADGVRCLSAPGLGARDAGSAVWQERQCGWNTRSPSAVRSRARATPTVSRTPSNAAAQGPRAADLGVDTIIGVGISYQAFISGPSRGKRFSFDGGEHMQPRALGLVVVALMVPAAAVAGQPAGTAPTFSKDIAPILQRSCQNCHNPNGGAPMSLVTYEEARPWARSIKLKVAKREMPPYFVEPNVGIQKFKDDPRLSQAEIEKVAPWTDGGPPRGNPADAPPPRTFAVASDWTIGKPDLIMSSPTMTVNAVAPDWHGEIGLTPIPVGETRYIKAVEVKEIWVDEKVGGFRYKGALVHHAALHAGPKEKFEATANVSTAAAGAGRFRLTYELGQNATVYPDMVAVKLEPDSVMYYSMHLHANGVETRVRVDVGFVFHPLGYQPKYPQSGFEVMGQSEDLDLPGGQDNIRVDGV